MRKTIFIKITAKFSYVKATALFYAIAVSLIIAILSSLLIFYSYINTLHFERNLVIQKLQLNAVSGLNILLTNQTLVSLGEKKTIDLFNEGSDSVELERKIWGGFEICTSKAFFKNDLSSKTALTGYDFFESNETSLYLCDLGKPLSLCGKTVLKGVCFIPKAGVKRGYIEGQNFYGDKLIDGTINTSQPQLPEVNKFSIKSMEELCADPFSVYDSIINMEETETGDTIFNSFMNKTLVIYKPGIFLLDKQDLSGNIVVYSKKQIIVQPGSRLKDIILIAPSVIVEEEFSGSFQVFVKDSAVVKRKCNLQYPTLIGLISNEQSFNNAFIRIEEHVKITGILFAFSENSFTQKKVGINIGKDAELRGEVFSSGWIDLKGTVYGSLFCNRFILKTPSSVYENHLLNATVDFSKLSPHFAGIDLIEQSNHKKIVKWLF